jgi:molecular chaperone GrpE
MEQAKENKNPLNEQEKMTDNTEPKEETLNVENQEQKTEPDTQDNFLNELQEAKDKYLRVYAEFENFRKRNAKERLELIQTAGKEIISELIQVLDDFERSLKAENKDDKVGMELIYRKLQHLLISKGLKSMDVLGKPFDPELHEAITQIPVKDKKQKGKIVDVIENGYTLNGVVIRYAKVVVGE